MKKIILSLFISVLTIGFVKSQNWQLLIPSTSFNGNYLNLSATAFDRSNNKIFSLRKDQTADMLYAFDLNNNSVSQINTQNSPADLCPSAEGPISPPCKINRKSLLSSTLAVAKTLNPFGKLGICDQVLF